MAFWKKKTPQDLRRQRLEQIERDRIGQHEHLDYHYAMVAMQDEQIARLKEEIAVAELGWQPPEPTANPGFATGMSARQAMSAFGAALRKIRGDLEVVDRG